MGERVPTPPAAPSTGYANYVLGVLFLVYVLNFVDRQAMAVFLGPIKEEFQASDAAMGFLVGFAFALLYTVAGIPIARLADRGNRRNIIALGLALWSSMTALTGFARNFAHLVAARVGVGIGEAACTPPAHSLIADYFPVERRGTALAIYSSAVFVGSALAYLGGGYLREHFDWRTGFIVLGLPGLLVAVLLRATVREPVRGQSEARTAGGDASLAETLRHLVSSRAWVWLMAGASCMAVTGYAVLMWAYEFFGRLHGLAPLAVGQWMALIVGVGGFLGTLLGGRLVDRMARRRPGQMVRVPGLWVLAGLPFGVVFVLAESTAVALAAMFPFYLLLQVYIPAMYTANQNLARLEMRATASAICLFIINIVGAGFGPFLVGALSDFFALPSGAEGLRYAMLVTVAIGAVGCALFAATARTLAADLARAGAIQARGD
ncbi:MAG: MFS transporter [Porticoccaceae bacterium]|nr:MAG: MFS transporter [Porticoccaceae bacterium]